MSGRRGRRVDPLLVLLIILMLLSAALGLYWHHAAYIQDNCVVGNRIHARRASSLLGNSAHRRRPNQAP